MKAATDPVTADRQFFTALIASDVEALDRLLTDDFILIDVMRGDEIKKSSLLDVLRSGQVRFAAIEPSESNVRLYDRTAIIIGRSQMKGHFGETAFSVSSRYTHAFIEQEGRWRLVSAQGTQIPSSSLRNFLMSPYVPPTEQLVTEIVVRNIRRSTEFYRRLGFALLRDGGDFVELTWEDHRLFLAELSAFHGAEPVDLPAPPRFPPANVRVMVPNVDDCWKLANEIGAPVIISISDRYYGLRDFTIADPDGFGIRFATVLPT
jgi:catechol 2,3-dioxygenase-like lactoylglutathione lyase family enzyme/ketosteroid isomerase-like protein